MYESKKIQAELLSELEIAEENLEEQIRENQGILDDNDALKIEAETAMNKIYYSHKNDKIDQALGKCLNNYPER